MFRITPLLILCLPVAAAAQSLSPTLVARTGQDAAGVPGASYTSIGVLPRLGANGHVAFNSSITGGGATGFNDCGYWVGTPGNLQVAVRESTDDGGPELFSGSANVGVDSNGTISIWNQLSFPVPLNQNQLLRSYMPNGNG